MPNVIIQLVTVTRCWNYHKTFFYISHNQILDEYDSNLLVRNIQELALETKRDGDNHSKFVGPSFEKQFQTPFGETYETQCCICVD
jgi:hypothetical protein